MQFDLAILGSGFGGSITALVAKQMGMNPVLIEKGTHPRFAIGESSTPQANIALTHIAKTYNLPRLKPLARYGTWKDLYPELNCGPKRGFTYVSHPNIDCELLVEASPDGYDCDTQWDRADLDAFLVHEVKSAGISYFDSTTVSLHEKNGWQLHSEQVSCTAEFLVDATGGANPLDIPQDYARFHTNSRGIFSHFKGVVPWDELHGKSKHPYPCHEAALHHVFDGGWMYVLHFDNGITSAGFILDCDARPEDTWESLMREFPHIHEQFQNATSVLPVVKTERMQRCSTQIAGSNWAMLPSSAYCIDPLHSTGIAHTLYCIDRLMQCIQGEGDLQGYSVKMQQEMILIDQLVHGSYACMHDFESLTSYLMLYFAGADFTERQRRSGMYTDFLNSDDQAFCKIVNHFYQQALTGTILSSEIAEAITPWNEVGLCDPVKQNMYEYAS